MYSCPSSLCAACWDDVFGPGCRFADVLRRGITAEIDSDNMPRLRYTRNVQELKMSSELGCCWCNHILSSAERELWDHPGGPAVVEIEINAYEWRITQDRLHIRAYVVGFEWGEDSMSCYTKEGKGRDWLLSITLI